MSNNRDNTTRTKARRRAVELVYEADVRGEELVDLLQARLVDNHPPIRDFTQDLVRGVAEHRGEVDEILRASLSEGWSLERMPRVDRALARVGAYELAYTETPLAIVADEAGDLAAELSTDQSPNFLTSLLDRVSRTLSTQPQTHDEPAGADEH